MNPNLCVSRDVPCGPHFMALPVTTAGIYVTIKLKLDSGPWYVRRRRRHLGGNATPRVVGNTLSICGCLELQGRLPQSGRIASCHRHETASHLQEDPSLCELQFTGRGLLLALKGGTRAQEHKTLVCQRSKPCNVLRVNGTER